MSRNDADVDGQSESGPTTVPTDWAERLLGPRTDRLCELRAELPHGAEKRLVTEGFVEPERDPLEEVEIADESALRERAASTADEGRRYDAEPDPPAPSLVVYGSLGVGAAVAEGLAAEPVDELVLTEPVRGARTVTETMRELDDRLEGVERVTLAMPPDDAATRHLAALGGLDKDVGTAVDPAAYPAPGRADYGGRDGGQGVAERVGLLGTRVRDLLRGRPTPELPDLPHRTGGDGWRVETDAVDWDPVPDTRCVVVDGGRLLHLEETPAEETVDRLLAAHDPDVVRGPGATRVAATVVDRRG